MKTQTLFLLYLLLLIPVFGSCQSHNATQDNTTLTNIMSIPTFMDGDKDTFYEWVHDQLEYPKNRQEELIEVYATFKVNTEGQIVGIKISYATDQNIWNQAYRVLKNSPNWKPATFAGTPIDTEFLFCVKLRRPAPHTKLSTSGFFRDYTFDDKTILWDEADNRELSIEEFDAIDPNSLQKYSIHREGNIPDGLKHIVENRAAVNVMTVDYDKRRGFIMPDYGNVVYWLSDEDRQMKDVEISQISDKTIRLIKTYTRHSKSNKADIKHISKYEKRIDQKIDHLIVIKTK